MTIKYNDAIQVNELCVRINCLSKRIGDIINRCVANSDTDEFECERINDDVSALNETIERIVGIVGKKSEKVPFDLPSVGLGTNQFEYQCCSNCVNNPKNNPSASGICHCVLPLYEKYRNTTATGTTVTDTTFMH